MVSSSKHVSPCSLHGPEHGKHESYATPEGIARHMAEVINFLPEGSSLRHRGGSGGGSSSSSSGGGSTGRGNIAISSMTREQVVEELRHVVNVTMATISKTDALPNLKLLLE